MNGTPPTGRVVLHIGAEKTGTTLLQEFLHSNRRVFIDQGVHTGDLLGDVNSHILAAYALTVRRVHDVHTWHGVTEENQEEFRDEFRGRIRELLDPGATYVFSNEHLSSRVVRSADIRRLLDLFTECGFTCHVVFFVRRQDAMIESSYSTHLKSGGVLPFDVTRSVTSVHRYDFADVVRRWGTQNGQPPRVSLFHEGCSADDLAHQLVAACDLEWDERLVIPEYQRNPSLDFRTLELLRALNEAQAAFAAESDNPESARDWPFSRRTLVRTLEKTSRSRGSRMTMAEREFVTDTFRASNEALAPFLSAADIAELCAPPVENLLRNDDQLSDAQIRTNFMRALAGSVRQPVPTPPATGNVP